MLMDAVYTALDSFHDVGYDKEVVMEKIEGKADSAVVVVHKLLRSPKPEQLYLKYAHDILGVVAILGEFQTHKLSRLMMVSFSLKTTQFKNFLGSMDVITYVTYP